MYTHNFKIAELNKDQLAQIKELEEKTGACIMAYKPEYNYAELDEEKLDKIKEIENDLGVTLLAYKKVN